MRRIAAVFVGSGKEDALARMAEALLAYGTTTSLDVPTQVVWIDVTGCAHLSICEEDPIGECSLAERILHCVKLLGSGSGSHALSVAIADGPRVASAVARFAKENVVIVPPGDGARALQDLPLAALPLAEETIRWLSRLGMKTVGDVQKLPSKSLTARLGALASEAMAFLRGEDATPLVAYIPPQIPEETIILEYGIDATESLLFVAKTLCDRMTARLSGRGLGITELELVLNLDAAIIQRCLLGPRPQNFSQSPQRHIQLALSAPLKTSQEMLSVIKPRVDVYAIEAPILSVVLRATKVVPCVGTPLQLFAPESKAEKLLPRLIAELESDIGNDRVGVLSLPNRWLSEERSILVPVGTPVSVLTREPKPESSSGVVHSWFQEPSRTIHTPILTDVSSLRSVFRMESIEWWKQRTILSDFGTAWIDAVSAEAWIEYDRVKHKVWIRGWLD